MKFYMTMQCTLVNIIFNKTITLMKNFVFIKTNGGVWLVVVILDLTKEQQQY